MSGDSGVMEPGQIQVIPKDAMMFRHEFSVEEVVDRVKKVKEIMAKVMEDGVHFGKTPGTDKPSLKKPGAELLDLVFRLDPQYQSMEQGGEGEHLTVKSICTLWHIPTGQRMGSGEGSCSTRETKYAFRHAKRKCLKCGAEQLNKSKFPPRDKALGTEPGWYCHAKAGGCGAEFAVNDMAITSQQVGLVANPNPADQYNTVLKMANKRCLHPNTPVVVKTQRGVIRSSVKHLAEMFAAKTTPLYLPGVGGTWQRVEAIEKSSEARHSTRIVLRDGVEMYATPEHRFPTTDGLKSVADLCPGDRLLRSRLPVDGDGSALPDFGWLAGLFMAEGCYADEGNGLRLTLHADEQHLAKRAVDIAEILGCTNQVKVSGNVLRVDMHGEPIRSICERFVEGRTSGDKHLSRWAWKQGESFLRAMLDGYLVGDGHLVSRGDREYWRLGFTGRNTELAADLRTLAAMLGWRIALHRRWVTLGDQKHPAWHGWLRTEAQVAAYHPLPLEEIVEVRPNAAKTLVYDIQVDGDHLFCLGGGVQTHNSLIAAVLNVTAASDIFTQDLDEMDENEAVVQGTVVPATEPSGAREPQQAPPGDQRGPDTRVISDAQKGRMWAIAREHGWSIEEVKALYQKAGFDHAEEITRTAYEPLINTLKDRRKGG